MGNVMAVLALIVPLIVFLDVPVLRQDAGLRDRIFYPVVLFVGLAVLIVSQFDHGTNSPLWAITHMLKPSGEVVLQWRAKQ